MKTAGFILGMTMLLPAVGSAGLTEMETTILRDALVSVKQEKIVSYKTLQPVEMAEFAYQTGKPDNIGESLRAIVFLESTFGRGGRVGDNGFARGCTQIQLPTAAFILKKLMGIQTAFTSLELMRLYTYNDRVSIIMSKEYLLYLMKRFKSKPANWSHGILGYNRGPSAVSKDGLAIDKNNYVAKAKKFIKENRR